MEVIWSFILSQRFPILFVLAQNMANHVILLDIQFVLLDIRVPVWRHLLCALSISLLYIVPIYVVNYFVFGAGFYSITWLYGLLMFLNPLSMVGYYFALKAVLRLSQARTKVILHNHLLMHYIVVLVYMCMNNIWLSFFEPIDIWGYFWLHEVWSILLIIVLLLLARAFVKSYLGRSRRYILIPPNYTASGSVWSTATTFVVLSVFYGIVIFFRSHWLPSNLAPITLESAFIYALLIVGILLYLGYSLSRMRISIMEWEMQATETYISSLLHTNQEFRGVKHDFYNILQTYSGYLELGDHDGLLKYHQSLFHTTKRAGDFLSVIEVLKPRIAVYSLLEAKAVKAEEAGVTFSIDRVCDIADVALTDLDLCRVLSVILDNAIEEAAQTQKRQMSVSFERRNKDGIVVTVSNTTSDDVDTGLIFGVGYTTKPGHSGTGLPQISHILNAYEHCALRASYHEHQFTMFLILHTIVGTVSVYAKTYEIPN